jgi:uncharacterized SAM-binding protein YcdF (DUF218 family)
MSPGIPRILLTFLGLALLTLAVVGVVYAKLRASVRETRLTDPDALRARLGAPVPAVVLGMRSAAIVDRAELAAVLWRRGLVSFFVTAGGQVGQESEPESSTLKRKLIERGVPAERIVEENRSRNTWENLLRIKPILAARGAVSGPILILTHDYHGTRAVEMAETLGLHAIAVTTPGHWAHPGFPTGLVLYEVFFYSVWQVIKFFCHYQAMTSG